jgi:hypothetical protein
VPFPPASVSNNRDQLGRGGAALARRGSMPRLVVGGTQVGYITQIGKKGAMLQFHLRSQEADQATRRVLGKARWLLSETL